MSLPVLHTYIFTVSGGCRDFEFRSKAEAAFPFDRGDTEGE